MFAHIGIVTARRAAALGNAAQARNTAQNIARSEPMTAQVGMISDVDTRSWSDALKSLPNSFESLPLRAVNVTAYS
jgi:hypothetical protein